jgi:hypothetical protein
LIISSKSFSETHATQKEEEEEEEEEENKLCRKWILHEELHAKSN